MVSHDPVPALGVDPTKPSMARVNDYLLGGKDNFEVDRQAVEMYRVYDPKIALNVRRNREFRKRAVRYIAEQRIRQFIDFGSGIPTSPPSVHDAARAVDPSVRVVYIDSDPVVVAHSRALRTVHSGLTTILADIRNPEKVLGHPDLRALVDFDEPIGLVFSTTLCHVEDEDDPAGIVAQYSRAMTPGSYFAISDPSTRTDPETVARSQAVIRKTGIPATVYRSDDEILRYFEGFDLVEPGLVDVGDWRPEMDAPAGLRIKVVGGVGRKSS